MSDALETSKGNSKKSPTPKKVEKFWQLGCVRQLFSQTIVSLFLVVCIFVCVFYSSSFWENSLFPGLRKIDPLQRDLTILQAKVDQLTQTVQTITDRGTEIETLRTQVLTLQNTLATLEKEGMKPTASQAQADSKAEVSQISTEVKVIWDQLKARLQQGEVCTDTLAEFKAKVPSIYNFDYQLQKVEAFAQTPAKSLLVLADQLDKIYQMVKVSPLASERVTILGSESWLARVWKYLSKWVQIRSLENKGEQVSVTTAFEKALQALKSNQLGHTIEYLKSLPLIEAVQEWLNQAEQRHLCDGVISEVDKLVAQPVKG